MFTAAGSQGFDPRDQGTGIAGVGPDLGQATVPRDEATQQSLGTVAVLLIGGSHIDPQERTQNVDQDVTFAPGGLLAGVVAPYPALVAEPGIFVQDDGAVVGDVVADAEAGGIRVAKS